jgi:hypothetical protein
LHLEPGQPRARIDDPGERHAGDLAPAIGFGHRACSTPQPLPQGVDTLEDAFALARERAYGPLADTAALEAEPVQDGAECKAACEAGDGELEEFAVLAALLTGLFVPLVPLPGDACLLPLESMLRTTQWNGPPAPAPCARSEPAVKGGKKTLMRLFPRAATATVRNGN